MSKIENVLKYLKDKGNATKDDIRHNCRYANGGDAIHILRNRGHIIETLWEYTSTGAKYANYIYKGFKNES